VCCVLEMVYLGGVVGTSNSSIGLGYSTFVWKRSIVLIYVIMPIFCMGAIIPPEHFNAVEQIGSKPSMNGDFTFARAPTSRRLHTPRSQFCGPRNSSPGPASAPKHLPTKCLPHSQTPPSTYSHSLWLHIYTLTDDHRSHAAVFELCPHSTFTTCRACTYGTPAARAEAISEEHHRRSTTAGVGVAELVY
jgi:hypothetical protein